ncbi:MAG: DUF3885 domain-containing protein [Cyanobacteria bacterium P01_G01_bin.67]
MQDKISAKFGEQALDSALFYNHEGSLRFELSGGSSYIEMFLRAYDRSKSIFDVAFQDTDTVSICLTFYGSGNFVANLSVFRSLKECQIIIPKNYYAWQKSYSEFFDEPNLDRNFICFEICKLEISKFLWGTLANEIGIRPRSNCNLYIFDLKESILMHPYDDRGIDIIGSNKTKLKQLYISFNEWLLDCDRQKIMAYFEI